MSWWRAGRWPVRPATAAGVDSGLQPERTTLSWSRTGLALVTGSAVFLRWVPHYGLGMLLLPLVTLVCALVIAGTHNRRLNRGVAGIHGEATSGRPEALLGLVWLLIALALAGMWFVLHSM